MRHLHAIGRLALVIGLHALSVAAAEVKDVTDIPIFSLLAPCAASALSYEIFSLTYSTTACGDSPKSLQACACSNTADSKKLYASVSSNILSNSCVSSASEDVASASKVMDQYCNQAETVTFATPTANLVNAYITDLPQMAYLPPCAQSAVSYVVMGTGSYRCPQAAQLFAPCVCSKSDVVQDITDALSKSAKYSCSNNDDATAAARFYTDYCNMNKGTTHFAAPSGAPGKMSYYITALPQFKALPSCARSAVSVAVQSQSTWLCGSGPDDLASCVCLKSGMSPDVSTSLTTEVKYACDSTAIDVLSSAVAVWDYYCSAANGKVTATVTESIAATYTIAETGSASTGAAQTGSSTSGSPSSSSSSGPSDEKKGGVGIVPIAAGAVGAIAVIGLGIAFFMFWRRKRRQANGQQLPGGPSGGDNYQYNGKAELMGNTHMGEAKPSNPFESPGVSELGNTYRPELGGGDFKPTGGVPGVTELPPNHAPAGGFSSQTPPAKGYYAPPAPYGHPSPITPPQEMPSPGGWGNGHSPQTPHGQPVYEFPAHPAPSAQKPNGYNGGWQSGPVEAYELDSNMHKWK